MTKVVNTFLHTTWLYIQHNARSTEQIQTGSGKSTESDFLSELRVSNSA